MPGNSLRTASTMPQQSARRTPAASARLAAAWITGPSATGSEKGSPSSSASAPDCASTRTR